MANQWFKFYGGEYLSDPKMLQLNASERSCWVTLLCLASQSENGEIKFFSEAQLLALSGVTDNTSNVLKKFEELEMIRFCNGIVTVINWQKRQYSEGYSRVQQFRKRKSNTKDNDRIEENRIEEKREDLPEWLNKKVWDQWIAYRKEIKKALKPSTVRLQLGFLEKNKVEHTSIILQSIQNGWTGLFALKKDFMRLNSDYARAHEKRIQEDKERREFEEMAKNNDRLREVEKISKALAEKMKV